MEANVILEIIHGKTFINGKECKELVAKLNSGEVVF